MSREQQEIKRQIEEARYRAEELRKLREQQSRADAERIAKITAEKEAKRKITDQEEWEIIKPLVLKKIEQYFYSQPERQEGELFGNIDLIKKFFVRVEIDATRNISLSYIRQQMLLVGVNEISTAGFFSSDEKCFGFAFRLSFNHQFLNTPWGRELQQVLDTCKQIRMQEYLKCLKAHVIKKLGEVHRGEVCEVIIVSYPSYLYKELSEAIKLYSVNGLKYLSEFFPSSEYEIMGFVRETHAFGECDKHVCYLQIREKPAPRLGESRMIVASEPSVSGTMVLSAASTASASTVAGSRIPVTHAYSRYSEASAAAASSSARWKERCKSFLGLRRG